MPGSSKVQLRRLVWPGGTVRAPVAGRGPWAAWTWTWMWPALAPVVAACIWRSWSSWVARSPRMNSWGSLPALVTAKVTRRPGPDTDAGPAHDGGGGVAEAVVHHHLDGDVGGPGRPGLAARRPGGGGRGWGQVAPVGGSAGCPVGEGAGGGQQGDPGQQGTEREGATGWEGRTVAS